MFVIATHYPLDMANWQVKTFNWRAVIKVHVYVYLLYEQAELVLELQEVELNPSWLASSHVFT